MPVVIDPGDGAAFGLDDLVAALDAHRFDARDEASLIDAAPLLARLGRHPTFLTDLAIAELETRCAGQSATNSYGAQSFLLRPANGRYVLRANFWPARDDALTRASGEAAFLYDHAHDHNFPFLTYGYLGPGYWSDYFERGPDAVAGLPGEPAGLSFTGRRRLEPGQLMLYRMRRDVHRQLPPDAFSVSLNILAYDPGQPWVEQYRFDVEAGTIAEGLTVTPSEVLVAVAAHLGGDAGAGLVQEFAGRHPCPRMRVTALDAMLSADPAAAWPVLEAAAGAADRYVAGHARMQLDRLAKPLRYGAGPGPGGQAAR